MGREKDQALTSCDTPEEKNDNERPRERAQGQMTR